MLAGETSVEEKSVKTFVCKILKTAAVLSHGTIYIISYVVLTFKFVDEILWCDHSNEASSAVFSHGTIYLVCSSNF